MPKSPRKEAGSAAVKPKMAAAEALVKARESGEGPVFSEDQQARLTALCKLQNVCARQPCQQGCQTHGKNNIFLLTIPLIKIFIF